MSSSANNKLMTFSQMQGNAVFYKNNQNMVKPQNQSSVDDKLKADTHTASNKEINKKGTITASAAIVTVIASLGTLFGLASKGKNINKFANGVSDENLKLLANIQEGFKYTVSKVKSLWNNNEKIKCDNINDKIKIGKTGKTQAPQDIQATTQIKPSVNESKLKTDGQIDKKPDAANNSSVNNNPLMADNSPATNNPPQVPALQKKEQSGSKKKADIESAPKSQTGQLKQQTSLKNMQGVDNTQYKAYKQMYEKKFYGDVDPKIIEALGEDFEKYMISGGCIDKVAADAAVSNMKKISEEFSSEELKKIVNTEDGKLVLRYHLLDFANKDKRGVFEFLHNLASNNPDGAGKQIVQQKLAALQAKNPALGHSESVVNALENLKPETLAALSDTTFIEILSADGPKERILSVKRIKNLENMFTTEEIQKLNPTYGSCEFGRWLRGWNADNNLISRAKWVTGKDMIL